MQRAVDTSDFLDLQEAKRLIDNAFKGGTAWYPDEQADLHGASSALARVIAELRRETPVMAIARRLASTGGRSTRGAAQPATGGTAAPVRGEPDGPRRTVGPELRNITDWDEVERALGERERLRKRISPELRGITDWGKIDRALGGGAGPASGSSEGN